MSDKDRADVIYYEILDILGLVQISIIVLTIAALIAMARHGKS